MPNDFTPILKEFPQFGPLQGIRILDSGGVVAGPWGASLAAEFGAEVIKIEALSGDIMRGQLPAIETTDGKKQSTAWAQDFRNKLDIALNFKSAEGKEIFARLIKESDIWTEASIPGTYANSFGISDEWVHSINPKIVIAHVSGFGQTGDPNYVHRPSYDMIGQAFSGFCDLNGFPDGPPMRTGGYTNDYIAATWALWSSLAAYIYAQKTGKGQSIDIAQFEPQFRMGEAGMMDYLMLNKRRRRAGNYPPNGTHPFGIYPCKDGYIALAIAGEAPLARTKKLVPELNNDKYSNLADQITYGSEIKEIIERWLSDKTASEVEDLFVSNSIPATQVMTYESIENHPHYKARDMLIEWEDPTVGKIKGVGLTPKFSETPGLIWRGSPTLGMDTDEIMEKIGFSEDETVSLKAKGVIK
ncbi:CaiB/BaiF CoA transferase family protein [Desulfitobacterium hafniense]|uniref:CoA transferase n=1 Tax=Desulfitobacterium hafniense (strain Y51) TaxID=138119 RepID=Q24QV4_DESHY|nr:CoA transferase [Desulfitobacterium hafniense]BAE85588.1 hypothetical protein DSY3799 [Desulfitobacterium hafniense Y51]